MEVGRCLEALGAGPYTYAVTTIWINRAIVALAAVGIAISASLSYFVVKDLLIPCGGNLGCQFVQMHESSHLGPYTVGSIHMDAIPVAYIGLAGYVLLFAIAVARTLVGESKYRILTMVGAVGAFAGFAFSGYLMYMSFAVIQQTCVWCISSFGTITLIAILHAGLFQFGAAKKKDLPVGSLVAAGAIMLSLGFVAYKAGEPHRSAKIFMGMVDTGISLEEALPKSSKVWGDANDKITLLEFADINCPACRSVHPLVKKIMDGGGVRLAYRHMLLADRPGHETSPRAALISEYAATQGKFWEFIDLVFAPENTMRVRSKEGLLEIAAEAGLDRSELSKIFKGEGARELLYSIDDDEVMSQRMHIPWTPTFIIYAEGKEPLAISAEDLEEKLDSATYKALRDAGR